MPKPKQVRLKDCYHCLGAILKHWCDVCKSVHEFGHCERCPNYISCSLPTGYESTGVQMREDLQ